MSCDTTAFGWGLSGFFYGFMFGEVVWLGVSIFIDDQRVKRVRTQLLEGMAVLMNELRETHNEKRELEEKLGRVYNSFETFKSELVGLEKYDDVPPVPPPAERTETYIDNNSIPAGPDEFEKVD